MRFKRFCIEIKLYKIRVDNMFGPEAESKQFIVIFIYKINNLDQVMRLKRQT